MALRSESSSSQQVFLSRESSRPQPPLRHRHHELQQPHGQQQQERYHHWYFSRQQRQERDRERTPEDNDGSGDGPSVACRSLLEPIDASLTLWSEGRREQIAELEAELRHADEVSRHNAAPRRKTRPASARASGRRECSSETSSTNAEESMPSKGPGGSSGKGSQRPESCHAGGVAGAREASPEVGRPVEDAVCRGGEGYTADDGTGEEAATGHHVPGLDLEERLRLWVEGWRPPPLRALPRGGEGFFSAWTHLGPPERFELVKSANRSVGRHGDGPLTDAELEWAVLCLEEAEARSSALQFSEAASLLQRVLDRCPGFTLAYYRLALCLLAARGAHASDQARRLLNCAMHLEGEENPHLQASVHLVLRILSNDAIPEAYWSDDYPKSLGDLRALESTLDKL